MQSINLQPAYILHTRNYRDSSLLIEALTRDFGRVSAVLRGAKSGGKAAQQKRGLVQLFVPLLISLQGKTDLKTLTHLEAEKKTIVLEGKQLFSAMYVNELLTRLLQHYQPQSGLFTLYQWVLESLQATDFIDVVLRRFELQLLELLGYGLSLDTDVSTGEPIKAGVIYNFFPEYGLQETNVNTVEANCQFRGEDLLALQNNDFNLDVRRASKRLCRLALQPHIGTKPLKSRELF